MNWSLPDTHSLFVVGQARTAPCVATKTNTIGLGSVSASAWSRPRSLLARAHLADLVLARQAERVEDPRALLREVGLEVHRVEQRVTRADVHAAARHGWSGPHGAEIDLFQDLSVRCIERDQLAAR